MIYHILYIVLFVIQFILTLFLETGKHTFLKLTGTVALVSVLYLAPGPKVFADEELPGTAADRMAVLESSTLASPSETAASSQFSPQQNDANTASEGASQPEGSPDTTRQTVRVTSIRSWKSMTAMGYKVWRGWNISEIN